jgi:hypothetical protein
MSEVLEQSIERKRREAIRTGVALAKLLTPDEAAFWKEQRRQKANANLRLSYARNRGKEIADQVRKQRTPEGKAVKVYFNTLVREDFGATQPLEVVAKE